MLNQHLLTCIFADAKATGNVKEEGHEFIDGAEVEVFSVVNHILNPMMKPVTLKRRISDGGWISMEIEPGYTEFMARMSDYINSLEEPIQREEADPLTAAEWTAWIKDEAKNHEEDLTDEQIGWIIEKLDEDGFVKEEGKTLFEISMNPYMDTIEFEGTLEEAKKEAEEMIAYNQYDIVIYENDEEVTRRRWCGIAPSEEDEEEDIIEIGDGFYSDWT